MNARDEKVLGKIPAKASHWGCQRKTKPRGRDGWEGQKALDPESGTNVGSFPIADLALATILERWGNGTFRVVFFEEKAGRLTPLGMSRTFDFTAKKADAAPSSSSSSSSPATAAAPAGAPPGFETVFALESLMNRRYEGILRGITADAEARVKAAQAAAESQVAMQTNFFIAVEKAKEDARREAQREAKKTGDEPPPWAAAIVERLDELEDALEEEEEEPTPAAVAGLVQADGSIQWARLLEKAIDELGPAAKAIIATKVQAALTAPATTPSTNNPAIGVTPTTTAGN